MYISIDEFINPDPFEKVYDDLLYGLKAGGLTDQEANQRIDAFMKVILNDAEKKDPTKMN